MDALKTKKRGGLILGLILLGALAFHLYEVDERWTGAMDYNGAAYGIMARNYVKYGFTGARFGQSIQTGPVAPGEFRYYLHHPPVFYWLVALSYHATGGVTEWSARLVPILFSLLSIAFFFRFVRRIWGVETAYYATFFLAFLPMNLYYSRIVLQESSMTLGTVLMLDGYARWRETRRPSDYWWIVAVFAVFGMLDWPAYYVLPLLTLHTLLADRGRPSPGRLRMLLLPAWGVVLFGLFLLYSAVLTAYQQGSGLLEAFIFRSAVKTAFLDYSFIDFLRMEAWRGYHLFTPIAPVLALFWIAGFALDRRDLERNLYVAIFLLVGAIHVFLFQDASYIHDFWMYPLCAGIALAAGIALVRLSAHPAVGRLRAARPLLLRVLPLLFLAIAARETYLLHGRVELRDHAMAGERIHEMSGEEDRVIIHWEDPVPEAVGHYFRYYGEPIYNKPVPTVAYYADRNIRWGLRDADDFRALLGETDAPYRFFLTRAGYLRDGMDGEIRRLLLERFEPVAMFDPRGEEVDRAVIDALLRGEGTGGERGLILFRRRTAGS